MIILWGGLWIAWLVSLVSMLALGWELWKEHNGFEPNAAFITSVATFIGTSIGLVLQRFFSAEAIAANKKENEKTRLAIDGALSRLDGEVGNFHKIRDKAIIHAKLHRIAVEVYSFDKVAEDFEPLLKFTRYEKLASQIIDECDRNKKLPESGKDVSKIIPLLEKIRPTLKRDLDKLGGPHEW